MSVLRPNRPDSNPCIGRCTHSVGDDVCKGCGRTINEVLDWSIMSSEQKVAVKALSRERIGLPPLPTSSSSKSSQSSAIPLIHHPDQPMELS